MTDLPLRAPRSRPWLARSFAVLLLVAMTAARAVPARAQSITAGSLSGVVRDSVAMLLPEVTVSLVDRVSGVRRSLLTTRQGAFSFTLLLPAEYDLVVEHFGYRPRVITRVPVRAGSSIVLDVVLHASTANEAPDSTRFQGAPSGRTHLALQGGHADDDFAALAEPHGLLSTETRILPGGDDDLGSTGLPGSMGAIAMDGITRWSPRHPRLPGAMLDGIAFPLAGVRGVEILPGGADVEWPGSGGGVLSASTTSGGRTFTGVATGGGGSDGFIGSLVLDGALVPDTAHFTVGISGVRLTPQQPAPWTDSSSAAAAAIARDSFQTDLSGYRQPYQLTNTIVSAFARFDGIVARNYRVMVRADGASATLDNPAMGPAALPVIGGSLKGRDVSATAALTSVVSTRVGGELRLGVDVGDRSYDAPGLVGTVFTDGGYGAGSSDLQPGDFKRTTFGGSAAMHLLVGHFWLKGGFLTSLTTYDQTYTDGRQGTYYFGDSTDFAARIGSFRQTVGSLPVAHYNANSAGIFMQARSRPVPGFEVIAGFRYTVDKLPSTEIRLNNAWLQATGIDNRPTRDKRPFFAPRLAFNWALGAARRWQVNFETGAFAEQLDAGVYSEAITHATGASVRRAFGSLGAWPSVPDSTVAPVQGQSLTMLGPQFQPPRTARVGFGIAGNLGGVLLRLQSDYRHTEFLPVRRDLNLALNPSARDQFGRPIYGTLTKASSLLGAMPGSNRRFAGFDEVSTLDPSGASDYTGFTVGLERDVLTGFALMASYTYSRTRDNWYGARGDGAEAQFVPFADSTGHSTWARDRSDFDVPQRIVLGAEWRLRGRLAPRIAVLYRMQSGYPFTPGFRDGVDANGDGSARNDPAFVTDTVSGATDIVGGASCLRTQIGNFAARNSCRDPSQGWLDLRLAATVARTRGGEAELMVDGFGLAHSGADLYDHALYLVDATRPLTTSAAGVVTVPLVANPNFGQPLVHRVSGALWRAGLRVTF